MSKAIVIMRENNPVLAFNFNTGVYKVYNESIMPFGLKGVVVDTTNQPTYEVVNRNYNCVVEWLGSRTLLLSRSNAKKIYNALDIEQSDSPENRARVSIMCRAVSVLDNYWLKLESDNIRWEQINVRHNSLNETIAQIALHGTSISVEGSLVTPELTTDGVYPKAWRRHKDDGTLWLYKADQIIQGKALIEVMCSNLMDKMNVQHCHYEPYFENGKQLCRCKSLTDDTHSIMSANTYARHCKNNNIPFVKTVMELDRNAIYKMCIVDYLISNGDRHSRNWGFIYKPHSMELIGCHHLFDHNNAFDEAYMVNRDAEYKFNKRSMRESAKSAMEDIDFHFTEKITKDDFLSTEQYEEFMWRANDLGIKIQHTYEDDIIRCLQDLLIPLHIKEVVNALPKSQLDIEVLYSVLKEYYYNGR